MSSVSLRVLPPTGRLARLRRAGSDVGSLRLIERHARAYRHAWLVFASGVFEPLFYLLSVGIGLGVLIGRVPGPGGNPIPYREFVAPGLLAVSSMNGAMYDSTFNIFFRLKYAKLYDAVLATPMRPAQVALGEIGWALLRGTIYAAAFTLVMLAMGLVRSPWAVLAVPVAVLIGFAFAALGMTGTTFMKSWQDFDYVILASMPLFLFSATFYPLSVYPRVIQVIVECTPLYQGVVLLRDLTVGVVGPDLLWRAAYLALIGCPASMSLGAASPGSCSSDPRSGRPETIGCAGMLEEQRTPSGAEPVHGFRDGTEALAAAVEPAVSPSEAPVPESLPPAARPAPRRTDGLSGAYRDPFIWVLSLAVLSAYLAISLFRLRQLNPSSWDLAVYTEYVKQAAGWHAPVSDVRTAGFNLLGDHLQPIVMVIAPLFRVVPSAVTLVAVQRCWPRSRCCRSARLPGQSSASARAAPSRSRTGSPGACSRWPTSISMRSPSPSPCWPSRCPRWSAATSRPRPGGHSR